MRKFKIFIFLVLFFFPLITFSHELFVEVEDKGKYFQINMRTYQNKDSICQFKLSRVDIEKPTFSHDGIIDLHVTVDTHKRCIDNTFWPCTGSFTFRRGSNIPEGRYSLFINDEDYGFLYVLEDKIYFDPINCL